LRGGKQGKREPEGGSVPWRALDTHLALLSAHQLLANIEAQAETPLPLALDRALLPGRVHFFNYCNIPAAVSYTNGMDEWIHPGKRDHFTPWTATLFRTDARQISITLLIKY